MADHLIFLLLGLANGAVFASLALALVVTYRSSGVVNFATSAIAMYGSYTFAFLRRGELLVLVPGFPNTADLGVDQVALPLAVAISLLQAALLGLLLYLVVFRPLRRASILGKAVASLGLLGALTGLMVVRLGVRPMSVDGVLPSDIWTVGDVRIASDRVWFAVVVVALAAALWAFFRFTNFGLATRAAAETERGAYLSGLSPSRLGAWNWVLGAMVAGFAGILIAPIVPLVPVAYSLFIIPALAAALVGGFQYTLPAVAAGLAIGMLQSEAQFLASKWDGLPTTAAQELIPLSLILIVLVVRSTPLPTRGAITEQSVGRAFRPHNRIRPTVLGTGAGVAVLVLLDGSWRSALIMSFIFSIIALSYVVITGYTGQVSLAQLTLAGSAGFLLGPISTDLNIPFPLAPLLAALGAAVIGVLIGLPALRVRGLSLAVVTLALAVTLEAFWFRNTGFVGASGVEIEDPSLFGLDLGIGSGAAFPRVQFGIVVLVVLVLTALGVSYLRTSRLGTAMLAVRANERSAAAAGVSVTRVKVAAFAIASFIAGLGGSLLGYRLGAVTFDSFTVLLGLALLGSAYVVGTTSVTGGTLAGIGAVGGLSWKIFDSLFGSANYFSALLGVGLVLTVIACPEGLTGALLSRLSRRAAVKTRPARAVAPVTVERRARPLHLDGLSVRYGGVTAVRDVAFTVEPGTVVGLIGPNGAGKTSLVDAVSGFADHAGSVRLGAQRLEELAPHRRIRAGLGRTFQTIELYDDLSVDENVVVGEAAAHGREPSTVQLDDVLVRLGIEDLRDRPAGGLSQGQRQLVSMARALAGDPEILLLDEPAGGLNAAETAWLGDRIRGIADHGVGVLLIDHDMHLVLGLCDRIEVLDFGQLIASGPAQEIRQNPAVTAAYLGKTHDPDSARAAEQ